MLQIERVEKRTKTCEMIQEMLIKTKPTIETAVTFFKLKL